MCLSQPKEDEACADVKIQLKNRPGVYSFLLKVDSGAQANTLPLRIFRRMYPALLTPDGFPVESVRAPTVDTRLTAYNGTEIRCYGTINLQCKSHAEEWFNTPFYIVDVDGPAILGLPSCKALKLITLHCGITIDNAHKINTVSELQAQYPDQFDKIGCFPGKVTLKVDPDATPHVDAPPKTPIALRDQIKSELDHMENLGVSLAYSIKKDGSLRVCLDPHHLNQAL
ncbi:hypothetical protein SNE40_022932 [Patella caerulea]|uniref:Uncharacterized protein n=1 Tax=Patella caerulea TaxID=87958 RepID=A0AAN8IZZ7_PATCE